MTNIPVVMGINSKNEIWYANSNVTNKDISWNKINGKLITISLCK